MQHSPAQFLRPDGQASALVIVKAQPLASELLAQDAILFLKIIEGILLPLVEQPASVISSSRKGSSVRRMAP
jgi:hypothetical protein